MELEKCQTSAVTDPDFFNDHNLFLEKINDKTAIKGNVSVKVDKTIVKVSGLLIQLLLFKLTK